MVLLALCLPGDTIEGGGGLPFSPPPGSDKLVHASLFFVETRYLRRAFRALRSSSPLALAIGVALFLSLATEVAQLSIPGRDGNRYDLLADALGVGLYAGLFRWRCGQEKFTEIAKAGSSNRKLSGRKSLKGDAAPRDEP
jgi:hypothetical protein